MDGSALAPSPLTTSYSPRPRWRTLGTLAEPEQRTRDELVLASDRDRHINLGFEAYRPVRPMVDKIRAENLLWHSLLHAGVLGDWDDPIHAIQRQLGRDRSVWGVFVDLEAAAGPGPLSWELRLLNTEARSPLGILDTLRETLAPWLELAPGLEQGPPYAILGLRFDTQTMARGRLDTVELHERIPGTRALDVYRTGVVDGEQVRERVSHDVVREPKREIFEVLPLIKTSEFVDFSADKRLLGRVMTPELFACRRVHICKRPDSDALCFSGLNIEQLAFSYKRFEFPAAMLAFLETHKDRLEHLLYDVAVDYVARAGRIVHLRCGFYSSF